MNLTNNYLIQAQQAKDLFATYDQDKLIAKLKLAGFDVTQATVSRDIRELKLLKQMSDMGTYKYVVPKNNHSENQHVYSRALASSIKSVDSSMNDIVIKTYPGMAQAVAAGVDSLHESDILGCVREVHPCYFFKKYVPILLLLCWYFNDI